MKMTFSSVIQEKFGIKQSYIDFKDHVSLDRFFEGILKIDVDFPVHHPKEFVILKSFDRAFWRKNLFFETELKSLTAKFAEISDQIQRDGEILELKSYKNYLEKQIKKCQASLNSTETTSCPFASYL